MCIHTPTFGTHTLVNGWPSQEESKKPPTQDQRLEIHTLYAQVNTQCIKMFTTHPHTWSPRHPRLSLLSRSVWSRRSFPPSILLFPLRRWRWLVKWEEEKAVIRPLSPPRLSSFDIKQRDERRQLASRHPCLSFLSFSLCLPLHVCKCVWTQSLPQISSRPFMVLSMMWRQGMKMQCLFCSSILSLLSRAAD